MLDARSSSTSRSRSYDAKSLQGIVNADGCAWIALKVDPVNADAVARKKADPEYLDVFRVGADGKAMRKARMLAKGLRYRFGVIERQLLAARALERLRPRRPQPHRLLSSPVSRDATVSGAGDRSSARGGGAAPGP